MGLQTDYDLDIAADEMSGDFGYGVKTQAGTG
jgi:hypothetical protein